MKRSSRFMMLLWIFVLAFGLVTPGTMAKEKVKLKLLIHNSDDDMRKDMDFIMPNLKKELPNIDVDLDFSPGDAQTFETKVRTLIAAGEGPDVWWERGGSFAVPIFAAKGALPMDKYLKQLGYWDMVVGSSRVPHEDGKIYAIPFETVFFETMFYNTELFKQYNLAVPKTVKELKNVISVFKSKGIIPIACAGKDGWPAAMMVEGFAYSIDPQITKKVVNGKAKFSDAPYRKAAQVVKELIEMGAFSKNVALTDYGESVSLFESGKAAMMVNGTWTLATSFKAMNGKCDYMYYPALDEAGVANLGKNVAGGVKKDAGIMVYAKTKHPREAVQLAMAVAKLRAQNLLVNKGDPFIVFKADKFGWKNENIGAPMLRLVQDMKGYKFTFGFVQDVMKSAPATQGVMEATSSFMTGEVPVDDYLKKMDAAAAEK